VRKSFLAIAVAASLALAILPAATSGATPAPTGLPAFYAVPSHWPSKAPGTYLKSEKVAVTGLNGTAYRVMYVSQADHAKAVAVTGYVIVPNGTAPTKGWQVVAWSHGTNGMADPCAPSLAIGNSDISTAAVNAFLAQGWAFVASDYQGEGTPGILPYIVGASAAEDTINLVRAAQHVPGADTSNTWVEWGHSEGGQTAMFVDQLAPLYGKGLNLVGVVAGAPPSQFSLLDTFLETSPYAFYIAMVAFGFHAYYGAAAPLAAVLTKKGQQLLPLVTTDVKSASECTSLLANAIAPYVAKKDFAVFQKANPWNVPSWRKLLTENDPGQFAKASPIPLLIIQGGSDEQIPTITTLALYNHLCGLGQVAQRWIYPGQSHAGVIAPSFADMVHWMADRFSGGPNPDPYVPVGAPGIVPVPQTCN
jgi:fermentation-respiration switch protein FrsA (DUF1100 family)